MRRWVLRIAVVLGLLAAMAALILPRGGGSGVPSRRALAREVAASRERVRDLTVSFTFDASGPGAAQTLHARSRMEVASKGRMLRVDHEYGAIAADSPTYRLIASFDGKRSMVHNVTHSTVTTDRGRDDMNTTTNGRGFFDVMMYHPEGGPGAPDLADLLASNRAKVRPEKELVGERPCIVVD